MDSIATKKLLLFLVSILGAGFVSACAALQPPDANGPRSNLPPYPIIATDPTRSEEASIAWKQLSQSYGIATNVNAELNPLTGTVRTTTSNLGSAIYLPKVGASPTQTEEEIRESLRRFIVEWRSLIGADPNQLSLVERTDQSPQLKIGRYEQRPFRYPLRGAYGKLLISFTADRRVLEISSTCLPNADRLQAALAALAPKVTTEKALDSVKGIAITAQDQSGQSRSFTLPTTQVADARQLVAYVLPSANQQSLEVHLAWEIDVTNGPIKTIYLDAITSQVIAVA